MKNTNVTKKAVIDSVLGFLFGIALLPALMSCFAIYGYSFFGFDLFAGQSAAQVLFPGYILTSDDIREIDRLSKAISKLAGMGVILGIAFAFVGGYTALKNHSTVEAAKSSESSES